MLSWVQRGQVTVGAGRAGEQCAELGAHVGWVGQGTGVGRGASGLGVDVYRPLAGTNWVLDRGQHTPYLERTRERV